MKHANSLSPQGGPGVTGTKGAPTAEPTEEPGNTGFLCTAEDNGEECCQRGGKDIHYCSGKFPRYRCYESTTQWCCTDGSVCDEEGCCDLFVSIPYSSKSKPVWLFRR